MKPYSITPRDYTWGALTECLVVIVTLLLFLGIFFHLQVQNHWTSLFGDRLDGEIEAAILEHWYGVLSHASKWSTTNYFYPHSGSLGYNDGYFIYGFIFSIFRFAGLDVFLSSEMVNVIVKSIGFLSLYWILRSITSLSLFASLLGAGILTISNNTYTQAIHAQLFSVGFAPLQIVLAYQAFRASKSGLIWQGTLWCAASAVFYCSWLMTAFYTAWFFAFFCSFATLVYSVLGFSEARLLWNIRNRFVIPGIVGIIILAIGLVPFALVYLPKAAETGMHPFAEALTYSPSIFDTINVGPNNWLFGDFTVWVNHLVRPTMPLEGERVSGLPPVLVLLFACATIWLWASPSASDRKVARAVSAAVVATWLLSLHFGSFTAWRWVYAYVPGAAAVRVIARYQIFLVFPVVVIVMIWLDALIAVVWRPFLLVLAALLIAEEVNGGYPIGLVVEIEMARLRAVPPVPAGCEAFATVGVRPGPLAAAPETDAVYSSNVDAMMIAEYIRLPTINGMASFVPPDWNFSAPLRDDYVARVETYRAKHGIKNFCFLNLQTLRWTNP